MLATPLVGKNFDRAIIVVFENTDYEEAVRQPFLKQLSEMGAHFSNFVAVTHPSQGNYIALTSGSIHGVSDDGIYNLNVYHIADLLESKGLTWKVYVEGFPGKCYTGSKMGGYVRKHNPMISYMNIQKNATRCANIVNAIQFDRDAEKGLLPNYVLYIPDLKKDGHDTGVAYADKWYRQKFSPYINNSQFMLNTILISTFDESEKYKGKNQIYTSIIGPEVKRINVSEALDTYSLLRLIEDNWSLGNLGQKDATATPISGIWNIL